MCVSHHSLQTYLRRKMLFLVFFLGIFLFPHEILAVTIAQWALTSDTAATTCLTSCNNAITSSDSELSTNTVTPSSTWTTKKWTTGTARVDSKYVEFSLSTRGYTALDFSVKEVRGGTSSPFKFQLYYSFDNTLGSAAGIAQDTTASAAATRPFNSLSPTIEDKDVVYFRLYAWADGGSGGGGGNSPMLLLRGLRQRNVHWE